MDRHDASTPDRILDAAIEAASIHGISKLTVADVASRAGVSRVTLYKHFSSKDDLVAAAVAKEARVMIGLIRSAIDAHADPRAGLEATFLAALTFTREHPLLDRIIRTEPEALLPLLVADGGAVSVLVRLAVEDVMRERFGEADPLWMRRFSDLIARLLISYAVNAPDDPPEEVAAIAAGILIDGSRSFATQTSLEKQ